MLLYTDNTHQDSGESMLYSALNSYNPIDVVFAVSPATTKTLTYRQMKWIMDGMN